MVLWHNALLARTGGRFRGNNNILMLRFYKFLTHTPERHSHFGWCIYTCVFEKQLRIWIKQSVQLPIHNYRFLLICYSFTHVLLLSIILRAAINLFFALLVEMLRFKMRWFISLKDIGLFGPNPQQFKQDCVEVLGWCSVASILLHVTVCWLLWATGRSKFLIIHMRRAARQCESCLNFRAGLTSSTRQQQGNRKL